jgi:Tfp pilus assembly protein PilF
MMTREEHLKRCKELALEYLEDGDVRNAVTSMLSDMSKHPETRNFAPVLMQLGMMYAAQMDVTGAERWINGFN